MVFHKGSARSRRPLPRTRMLIDDRSMSSSFTPRQLGHVLQTRTNWPDAAWPGRGCHRAWRDPEPRAPLASRPAEDKGPDADPSSLNGMARTQWTYPRAAGCLYSRKWKKESMAASRTQSVTGAFLRLSSRYSRSRTDEVSVELLQRQRRRRDFPSPCSEHEEQIQACGHLSRGPADSAPPRWRVSVSLRNASMRGAIGVMIGLPLGDERPHRPRQRHAGGRRWPPDTSRSDRC